jgi:RimJ/RimL family protein N-acetyltransferase
LTVSDVTIRPLAAGELDLFDTLVLDGPAFRPPGRDFLATAADHHYRPEWTWVAQRGDRVVARAAWWARPDDTHPYVVDWFDLGPDRDRVAIGARLLAQAHESGAVRTTEGSRAPLHLFLPPDGRDQPAIRTAAGERIAAAEQAGLRQFVERLRLEWDRSAGVPAPSGRLRFDPVDPVDPLDPAADNGALLELLERINVGTLDAHARQDLDRHGPAVAARIQLDDMASMPAPRSWWRTASTGEGELVGLVMPSRNWQFPVIGYVGVVPEQRGRGYVDDLLAEGTAVLAAEGAEVIRADTDVGNAPMAASFARSGYRVVGRRIVMT